MNRRRIAVLASFALFSSVAVFAKDKAPDARPFEMTVTDPAGVVLTDVQIVLKDAAGTALPAPAVAADGSGKMTGSFPDAAASYTVDLAKARFRPQQQTLNLGAQKLKKGDTAIIKFTMEPMTALDDYASAIKAIQAKDVASAESHLNLAVTTDPQFAKGYEVLAMVHLDQKEYAEGLAAADKALAIEAQNLSALRSRYDALKALERDDESIAALRDLAAKDPSPEVARLLYNAGAHAMAAKQNDRSRELLNEAIALDAGLYQAHAGLAELAIADKNFAEAVKQLDLAIGLAPRNFKAYERKIEVLKADGKAKEAAAVEAELAKKKAETT